MSINQTPLNWIKTQLGNVATFQRGNDLPIDSRISGKFPVIGSNGVSGHHSEFIAAAPGVLIGRSGSVGKVSWVDSDFWPLNTALWVKDFHDNDPKFIYYFLIFLDLGKHATGVSVPTLNRNIIHPLEVCIPPLCEQRTIARALRSVQQAKEAQQHELKLERERKAALMDYLFKHGTQGELCKQTEIGEMPESWEVRQLEDICNFTTGKLNSEAAVKEGEYPFFTCSKIAYKINSYSFDQEALLLAGNNAQGIYDVKYYKGKFDAYQRTYVISINEPSKIYYQYLLYELSLKLDLLRNQSLGAITKFLTASIIKNLKLRIPKTEEQKQIYEVLLACDKKINILEKEISLLDELFLTMLEELMTGRLSAIPLIDMEENQ